MLLKAKLQCSDTQFWHRKPGGAADVRVMYFFFSLWRLFVCWGQVSPERFHLHGCIGCRSCTAACVYNHTIQCHLDENVFPFESVFLCDVSSSCRLRLSSLSTVNSGLLILRPLSKKSSSAAVPNSLISAQHTPTTIWFLFTEKLTSNGQYLPCTYLILLRTICSNYIGYW